MKRFSEKKLYNYIIKAYKTHLSDFKKNKDFAFNEFSQHKITAVELIDTVPVNRQEYFTNVFNDVCNFIAGQDSLFLLDMVSKISAFDCDLDNLRPDDIYRFVCEKYLLIKPSNEKKQNLANYVYDLMKTGNTTSNVEQKKTNCFKILYPTVIALWIIAIIMLFFACREPKTVSKSEASTIYVYVTKTGSCYHKSGCDYLRYSKIKITLDEADKDYRACSKCRPPTIEED